MKIPKYRWLLLFSVVTLLCCDGADGATTTAPATPPPGIPVAVTDGGAPDGTTPDGRLTSCVDRPTDIPRPPTGRLPCELVPPGLTL